MKIIFLFCYIHRPNVVIDFIITIMNEIHLRKAISGYDIEYELKAYANTLQQYQDILNQVPQKYAPETYQQFKNQIMQSESYLEQFYEQNSSYRQILRSLLGNNIDTMHHASREYSQMKGNAGSMMETIQDKEMCLVDYRQKLQKSQQQIANLSLELETLRQDNISLHQKIDQKERQIESDRNQIRKTFMTVQEQSEQDKQMVEQLYDTQEHLRQQLCELINEKQFSEKRYSELEEELMKSNRKIDDLEEQIRQLNQEIQNLKVESENEYENGYNIRKFSAENSQDNDELVRAMSFTEHLAVQQPKNKLSEDVVNYKMPTNRELISNFRSYVRRSQDQLSDVMSVNHENEEPTPTMERPLQKMQEQKYQKPKIAMHQRQNQSKAKRNLVLDPYYSHYILTSQSVKIKEDCQDMLSIDMKPFYKQIVDKRIPMHLWDEWIRNRLREILKRKI